MNDNCMVGFFFVYFNDMI